LKGGILSGGFKRLDFISQRDAIAPAQDEVLGFDRRKPHVLKGHYLHMLMYATIYF